VEFVEVTTGASFEQMSASSVDGTDEQANAEGSLGRGAGLSLGFLLNLNDKTLARVL